MVRNLSWPAVSHCQRKKTWLSLKVTHYAKYTARFAMFCFVCYLVWISHWQVAWLKYIGLMLQYLATVKKNCWVFRCDLMTKRTYTGWPILYLFDREGKKMSSCPINYLPQYVKFTEGHWYESTLQSSRLLTIWSLMVFPSSSMVRILKSTPIVLM